MIKSNQQLLIDNCCSVHSVREDHTLTQDSDERKCHGVSQHASTGGPVIRMACFGILKQANLQSDQQYSNVH